MHGFCGSRFLNKRWRLLLIETLERNFQSPRPLLILVNHVNTFILSWALFDHLRSYSDQTQRYLLHFAEKTETLL